MRKKKGLRISTDPSSLMRKIGFLLSFCGGAFEALGFFLVDDTGLEFANCGFLLLFLSKYVMFSSEIIKFCTSQSSCFIAFEALGFFLVDDTGLEFANCGFLLLFLSKYVMFSSEIIKFCTSQSSCFIRDDPLKGQNKGQI